MAGTAPRAVMVAGPNGSGKTTLIEALRRDPRFDLPTLYVNADELQHEHGIGDARGAQHLATRIRAQALAQRADVMYETVMSHPNKIAELQRWHSAGYHITVLLVSTDDPEVNVQRVALRVAAGGHAVPEERTRARYARMLALAPVAIGYADQAFVFDNTESGDTGRGLSLQAGLRGSRLTPMIDPCARWVGRLVEQFNERAAELRGLAHGAQTGRLAHALAQLDGGSTSGPIESITTHYALQYDALSDTLVLHDRVLLANVRERLAAGQSVTIRYTEGVAEVVPAQAGQT